MKLTYPDWERYASDLKVHELLMLASEPVPEDYIEQSRYLNAKANWEQELFMNAPNKPGYYRANND